MFLLLILTSSAQAAKPAPAHGGRTSAVPCASSPTQRARVNCLVRAIRWERKLRAHVLRVRFQASLDYACRLGYAAFQVAVAKCKKVVGCESGGNAKQVTPPYGASGLAQFLLSTWRGTRFGRAGFDVFDPVPNVLAMDQIAASVGFNTKYGWRASHGCHGYS